MAKKATFPGTTLLVVFLVAIPLASGAAALVHHSTASYNDDFNALRLKWFYYLTGGKEPDTSNTYYQQGVNKIVQTAKQDWDNLNKANIRFYLWEDIKNPYSSGDIAHHFDRLRNMALAYTVAGSSLKGNKALLQNMLSSLAWLYENRFNEKMYPFFNWWHFEIGIPLQLNDILVLLYDHLTKEQLAKFIKASKWFSPNVDGKGVQYFEAYKYVAANRVWRCQIIALRGILDKNEQEVTHARKELSPVFDYVTTGDGFYTDGSFIQHGKFAYTGGYGNSLLKNIGYVLFVLKDSPWEVKTPGIANFYRWIYDSFEPVMYKGAMMDMVRARELSRGNQQDHAIGAVTMENILFCAQFAPEPFATDYKSMVKGWYTEDTFHNFLTGLSLHNLQLAQRLINDKSIPSKPPLLGNWQFANMDRVVHRTSDFAVGISMHSSRIWTYELHRKNQENLKGWYTGHGMTYLYNSDLSHYSNDYWAAVDAYRLPGTTVTRRKLTPGEGPYTLGAAWVGGTSLLKKFGITGMQLQDTASRLTGKKSWFQFDDEIVAIGSDINCTSPDSVETVIENRKLSGSYKSVMAEGLKGNAGNSWSDTLSSIRWMYLKDKTPEASIGYFFPAPLSIHARKETRNGSWDEWKPGKYNPVSRNFFTAWTSHGLRPIDQTYAYVLLPGKSEDQLKQYVKKPQINIIRNDKQVHAVIEKTLNLLGINFWTDGSKTVEGITCNKAAAILVLQEKSKLYFSISDPTHVQKTIEVTLNVRGTAVMINDSRISVKQLSPFIQLSIDVSNAQGKSIEAGFEVAVE